MISIIIPVYNKRVAILNTINSVLSQDYSDFEIICVDDGSTDESCDMIESIDDSRIRLFRKDNGGVSSARNYGIDKAVGEWCLFLDADDELLPNALSTLMSSLLILPKHIDVIIGNIYIDNGVRQILYCQYNESNFIGNGIKAFCTNICMPRCGNMLIKRCLLKDIRFNEEYTRNEDIDFSIRLLRDKEVMILQKPVMIYKLAYANLSIKRTNSDYLYYLNFRDSDFWVKVAMCILLVESKERISVCNNRPPIIPYLYAILLFLKRIISFKIREYI